MLINFNKLSYLTLSALIENSENGWVREGSGAKTVEQLSKRILLNGFKYLKNYVC